MTINEQRDMIERSLGERMLNHAFVILHQWLEEIGFAQYGDQLQSLEQNYASLFRSYLSTDDDQRNDILDDMTAATYRLVDDVYVDLCLKRGDFPQIVGFNRDNTESVVRYFASCPRLREEDLDYLRDITLENINVSTALLAMAAAMRMLRSCFSESTMLCIIEMINSENRLISHQALMMSIVLLVHYDIRIDYFPRIQDAFVEAIGDGEAAFNSAMALILNSDGKQIEVSHAIDLEHPDDLETALENVISEQLGDEADDMEHVVTWLPADDKEYYQGIASILPNTWVMDAVIGESEMRSSAMSGALLQSGSMDLWWDNLDEAERIITQLLRMPNPNPKHFINYGHICFVRGDKLMAYENYREARRLYGSSKEFLRAFRPDRRFLVDNGGISLDDVYLMEDQLLKA